MQIKISGLKCDHCTFRDDDVLFKDYKKSIGRRCPLCGEVLLTKEEYDECVLLYARINKLNKIGDIIKWFNPMHYWRLVFGDNREIIT